MKFAKKHTFIYCILAEIFVLGGMMLCSVAGMMGMAFAAIYFRSGNIWVVVFLHGFIDLCG